MKYLDITMKNINKVLLILSSVALIACTFDEEVDPNRPSLEGMLSKHQLTN